MTIQNLGSKGTAVDILPNDVLASTANGSGVDDLYNSIFQHKEFLDKSLKINPNLFNRVVIMRLINYCIFYCGIIGSSSSNLARNIIL